VSHVSLRQLVKVYGRQIAVKGIDLEIEKGSFVVLVGPSGCGKSTTLRMIAGLESVSHGEIKISGRTVNDLPARDRGIAMVFQSYALYPHMTVFENMSFALKVAKVPRAEIEKRVRRADILRLTDYLDRRTSQLSGGQRQRVAMGRAIVREPEVFLFDEPLSNLDAQLRSAMRVEIKRLHHQLGTTAIYVTHDQTEAMTMADKIVIMRDGFIEQEGAPLDVFERPANEFVARFIGAPAMNLLPGKIVSHVNGALAVELTGDIRVPIDAGRFVGLEPGRPVTFGARPEEIVPEGHGLRPDAPYEFSAPVTLTESLGNETLVFAAFAGGEVTSRMHRPKPVREGEVLRFELDRHRIHLFDAATGSSLRAE
jgi:multiple sugar transport system ATP-binding protein